MNYLIRVTGLGEIEALFLGATTEAMVRQDLKKILRSDKRIKLVWVCHYVTLDIHTDACTSDPKEMPLYLLCGIDTQPGGGVVSNFFQAANDTQAKKCARERKYKEGHLCRCERISPLDLAALHLHSSSDGSWYAIGNFLDKSVGKNGQRVLAEKLPWAKVSAVRDLLIQ